MKYLLNELLESIRYNKNRFFLTGLGISIGNIAVVIIIIVSYSFSNSMLSTYYAGKTTIGLVISNTSTDSTEEILKSGDMPDTLSRIGYLEGVASWEPAGSEKLVQFASDREPAVHNVEVAFEDVTVTEGGSFAENVGSNVILRKNDEFGSDYQLGDTVYINQAAYRIIGFTNSSGSFGNPMLFFPESAASEIEYTVASTEGTFDLTVRDGYKISEVRETVLRTLNQALKNNDAKFIDYSNETSKAMEETMKTVTTFLVLIAAISLIVAAINVVNIMYITALEKTHEIAVYRALGMKKITVLLQFLMQSSAVVLVFSLVGYLIGVFLSAFILLFLKVSFCVPLWSILITMVMGILIGVLSGIKPAMKAAEVSPAILLK